jgi:hypothetical protein
LLKFAGSTVPRPHATQPFLRTTFFGFQGFEFRGFWTVTACEQSCLHWRASQRNAAIILPAS